MYSLTLFRGGGGGGCILIQSSLRQKIHVYATPSVFSTPSVIPKSIFQDLYLIARTSLAEPRTGLARTGKHKLSYDSLGVV